MSERLEQSSRGVAGAGGQPQERYRLGRKGLDGRETARHRGRCVVCVASVGMGMTANAWICVVGKRGSVERVAQERRCEFASSWAVTDWLDKYQGEMDLESGVANCLARLARLNPAPVSGRAVLDIGYIGWWCGPDLGGLDSRGAAAAPAPCCECVGQTDADGRRQTRRRQHTRDAAARLARLH